ncbi:hypothetical protein L1887_43227 [Cichorium endivia]|nr:hypothetical protein L1887_43227 [Cichorium endivia]
MVTKPIFLYVFFIFFNLTSSSPSSPPLNFNLFGTANINHNSIALTQYFNDCISNPPYSNFGRVFYRYPIRFLKTSLNSTVSFYTQFSFTIIPPPPPCLSGEGIAFLITSDLNSLPDSIGSIGLPKSLDSSFLAVEFDTKFDEGLGDINNNHVGIDLDSISSVASVDLTTNGIDLKSGKQINAWIEYRSPENVIQIWVGYTKIKPESPILALSIDLSKRLNGSMYVGFSAANGGGSAIHLIHSWYFNTSESGVGSEKCFICFPEDTGKDVHKMIVELLTIVTVGYFQ